MGSNTSSLSLKVDLSNKGIRDLEGDVKQPHLLLAFAKLEHLNLSKNKIEKVPESLVLDIQKAPKVVEYLAYLNFSKNKLSSIPEAVFLLVNLRELYLDHNDISILNDRILVFYRLQILSMAYNRLKRIPWSIHKLHALRSMDLSNNEIVWLPNTLSRMASLEELDIRPNPLDSSYDGMNEDEVPVFMDSVKKQKIPPEYRDDYRKAKEEEEDKKEKLSADGRIVHALLGYREGIDALEQHMKKEFSVENLELYKAVREFRRKYNSSAEIKTTELVQDAKRIFETFILDAAPKQVNLPAEVKDNLKKIFLDAFNFPRGINQKVFNEAYRASFDLMVRDTFLRFRTTAQGKELVEQLKKVEGSKLNLKD